MKLISMTDFVLEQKEKSINKTILRFKAYDLICNYANFLKQPLKLEMFVCVDDDGNVLKGKPLSPATDEEWNRWEKEQLVFQQAQSKVLFDGVKAILENDTVVDIKLPNGNVFKYVKKDKRFMYCYDYNIEKMIYRDLDLTESALKQIGL